MRPLQRLPHGSRAAIRPFGFTIVELLVVVAIVAIIAAILLPALGGARRRARKADEMSGLRQVGIAWTLYANNNADRALPGFLPQDIQRSSNPHSWNVGYFYTDRDRQVDPRDAEAWPLRIAVYLDFDHDLLLGYRSLEYADGIAIDGDADGDGVIEIIDEAYASGDPIYNHPTERPFTASRQPAFGYNAYYVGGWYKWVDLDDVDALFPLPRWYRTGALSATGGQISVVAMSPSSIRQTSKMVLFCSSTAVEAGVHDRFADDRPGAHFVVPRWMEVSAGAQGPWASSRYWYAGLVDDQGDYIDSSDVITVQNNGPDPHDINGDGSADSFLAIPMGRHTGQAAVVHADGHTEAYNPGALEDIQHWVNGAPHPARPAHQNLPP